MPELPEVEFAVRRLRRVVRGRVIAQLRAHHRAQQRTLTAGVTRRATGDRIVSVERRGKHQIITLGSGATLVVHFRLNGDWEFGRSDTALPAHARVTLDLDNGRRAVLTDPRALCTVTWHSATAPLRLDLGPEPEDSRLTPARLRALFAARRGPVKPALLDQSLVAGVGNIYAAEACWHAGIAPTARAKALSLVRVTRLLTGLRTALADGHINAARYHRGERAIPFKVYDRDGEPCSRCGRRIRRIVQAGRGTWYCPGCQPR